ncbi:MAG: hypothetical protein WA208_15690 [Thermoanaerobaculia bacterium]
MGLWTRSPTEPDVAEGSPQEEPSSRQLVRQTAGRVLRSEDLDPDEKAVAAAILRDNPTFGNPHVVRCDWCRETRTLFRDENAAPFVLTAHGWRCEPCDANAASQEIRI